MLNEGLHSINSELVIIGITEHETVEDLDVLRMVSKEGFTTSAKVYLLEYCKFIFGKEVTENYLHEHENDSCLSWTRPFLNVKSETSKNDDKDEILVQAILHGNNDEIKKAVMAGGRIRKAEVCLNVIPSSNLSDEILEFIFANALTLRQRCLLSFLLTYKIDDSKDKLYDVLCNMVTIIVNLLIKDKGIVLP